VYAASVKPGRKVPVLRIDGDVVLGQGPLFRASVEAAAELALLVPEVAIDRTGAH
jgi:hypothetical protein